jgi:hypothetical protein
MYASLVLSFERRVRRVFERCISTFDGGTTDGRK